MLTEVELKKRRRGEDNFHVNPCRGGVSLCKDDARKSEVMRATARGGSASDCQNPFRFPKAILGLTAKSKSLEIGFLKADLNKHEKHEWINSFQPHNLHFL